MRRENDRNQNRSVERNLEPMASVRSDRQVTGTVLPLISNGKLDDKPDQLIGHKRLALVVNTRQLKDSTLVNDQGRKGAVDLPDFDTHLLCHVGSSCELFESAFESALDEHPDIQAAQAALDAAEGPYAEARDARETFWMRIPEYATMRAHVDELEKDIRALNVKSREGRVREREKRQQIRGLYQALDQWKDGWLRSNPGEQDLRPLKRAVDDAGKKLWYERKKRSELASRRNELVSWLAKRGVPNTEELDITYHIAGTGVIGHDRNVKLYEFGKRTEAFATDVLGAPLSPGEDHEEATVSFPLNHIWEAFREENRNKLYRPGNHGFFVYAPQMPRHEWRAGGESKPDTVKNLLLYGKIGNILIGRYIKERVENKERIFGWALLLRQEQIIDIVISQDFYRNRFAVFPAVLLEAIAGGDASAKTTEKIRKLVDPDTARAVVPHDLVRKLTDSLSDEGEMSVTLKGKDIRALIASLTLPSLVEQFATISYDPYEKVRAQQRAERKAAKKNEEKMSPVEAKPAPITPEEPAPETVSAVPHPRSTPPSETPPDAVGGSDEAPADKAEAKPAATSTPALN